MLDVQVGKLLFSLNIDPLQLPSGPAAAQDWDALYAQGTFLTSSTCHRACNSPTTHLSISASSASWCFGSMVQSYKHVYHKCYLFDIHQRACRFEARITSVINMYYKCTYLTLIRELVDSKHLHLVQDVN